MNADEKIEKLCNGLRSLGEKKMYACALARSIEMAYCSDNHLDGPTYCESSIKVKVKGELVQITLLTGKLNTMIDGDAIAEVLKTIF